MLPPVRTFFVSIIEMKCRQHSSKLFQTKVLRVELVLVDQSRKEPHYVGEWHMFPPSDVILGGTVYVKR